MVQEQKTTEEYFKTTTFWKTTFARRVIWNEWQSFKKHFERKSRLIVFSIYLFDIFLNVAEWRGVGSGVNLESQQHTKQQQELSAQMGPVFPSSNYQPGVQKIPVDSSPSEQMIVH